MLRRTLVAASRSRRLRRLAERNAATRAVAARFVAGDTLDEAVDVVHRLQEQGATVTLDLLGEEVSSPAQAEGAVDGYLRALQRIERDGLECSLSVKPSQFGIGLDTGLATRLLRKVAEAATSAGIHVTLDMEGSDTTSAIVDATADLAGSGLEVGCAVQAYLHRTPADVARLTALGCSLRLCKGAYAEDEAIAHQGRREIRAAYLRLADDLLGSGTYPRFATHDDVLVDRIEARAAQLGLAADKYEFQMLYGVREPLAADVLARGHRLRVYVPYGQEWYPYYVRRLAERPANLLFFGRALVGRRRATASTAGG